ncbi:MAG: hypothetical protein WC570_00245 [Patescibacteria group bacterium]
MSKVNWQNFGLKSNPYLTDPLVEGGQLNIDKAFVGRQVEIRTINDQIESLNNLCMIISGDVGVGKTSLVNYVKYFWKHKGRDKYLFSSRREIEANENILDKSSFLLEVIGSIIGEIELLDPDLMKDPLLDKVKQLIDVTQSISYSGEFSLAGFGGGGGKETQISQPIKLPYSILESYYKKLLDFVCQHKINSVVNSGLIIHVNNFDVVMMEKTSKKKVIRFFNEIRDILQQDKVYYFFLGPRNFYKDIISTQKRVKGVFFQSPLQIKPLSKNDVVSALNERMFLLKSEGVEKFIKPIDDKVVYQLYDLYDGDIRMVLCSLYNILTQVNVASSKTIGADRSKAYLCEWCWENVEKCLKITDKQKDILKYISSVDKDITQNDIAKEFKIVQTNVSGYYMKPLRENNIIEEKKKEGKLTYWGLTREYLPLKWMNEVKENMVDEKKIVETQLKLFG